MTFPQPPWNLFGVYRESERERLFNELSKLPIKCQVRYEDGEAKPYCLWVHDDDLQLAADTLFRESKQHGTAHGTG
jgi:hypothetical protein